MSNGTPVEPWNSHLITHCRSKSKYAKSKKIASSQLVRRNKWNGTNSNTNSTTNSTLSISKPQTEHNIERFAPNKPPKGTAALEPETTQHTVRTDSRQGTRNQKHYCLCQRLQWNRGYTETDTTGMLSPPTIWCQQSLFRADSLVRHLLQCA